jgi:hypothetical protein
MRLQRAAAIAVLSALTLGSATGRSDDASKAPPAPPAAGFLEFLGSVDRLSELNPDYLSPPAQRKTRPTANGGTRPAPPPPPPPPGDKNNG